MHHTKLTLTYKEVTSMKRVTQSTFKRRMITKMFSVVLIAAMLCVSIVTPLSSVAARKPKLAAKKMTIKRGQSKMIKIRRKKGFKISYKSLKKKIATVSSKGKVTGIKKGTGRIKVYYKKGKNTKKLLGNIKVTVQAAASPRPSEPSTASPNPSASSVPIQQSDPPVNSSTEPSDTVSQEPSSQEPTSAEPTSAEPTSAEPTSAEPTSAEPSSAEPSPTMAVANYPTLLSDIPDLDIIQHDGTFYMVSTTMNMMPGVPVMKSTDLVHWQICNYVYDTYIDDNRANLIGSEDLYRNGSWAASLRYNEANDLFYVAFNTNGQGSYIYTTDDIENGEWKQYTTLNSTNKGGFHDPGMYIEDGRIYLFSGGSITEVRLDDTKNSIERVGGSKSIVAKPSTWSLWEGAHLYKVGEYYYLFMIASPTTGWFRTAVCYRSKDLMGTNWEEKVVYRGTSGSHGAGLAQGGIVDTPAGDWYGFLFQDNDGLGRIPSIIAVEWQDDWPMMGTYDANGVFKPNIARDPMTLNLADSGLDNYFVGDDDFSYEEGEELSLLWQWNHNPQNDFWSVTENPGYLRITTDRIDPNVHRTRNSLTQRTLGPKYASEIKISIDDMKMGDYAGLATVAAHYAVVGVSYDSDGNKYLIQASGDMPTASGVKTDGFKTVNAKTLLDSNVSDIYLKIEHNFTRPSTNNANFYYSLDGVSWTKTGNQFTHSFSTSTTFMGARVWLFNYATLEAGGFVDFDYYKIYPY
jgi:beta-xylosidase